MTTRLGDVIRYRDDKIFQGAVDLSWFYRDRVKSEAAAEAFVFHGPSYHGVQQQNGYGEHKLTDTASFAHHILEQACGKKDCPFILAVAGYGTGKSHLAVALAELLHAPHNAAGREVLESIATADASLGQECRILLNEESKPSLVIALNGMGEFHLMSEIMRRAIELLRADGHDSTPIENVRPRFAKAASLIEKLDKKFTDEICREACKDSLESVLFALREEQNEAVYAAVANYLVSEGVSLNTSQSESLNELLQLIIDNYCGESKPYKSIIILFDEFGKYLEFAIGKPYIAGTGALQDLFESIQNNSEHVCIVGFIQFELKSYLQRLNPEYHNDAKRYIDRYAIAEKLYLSTNIETLIASLIEKKDKKILNENYFTESIKRDAETALYYLQHFFPASKNSTTWSDNDLFARVICQGCWPLSPYALWFIHSLASDSNFLQGRSALSLLKELFSEHVDTLIRELPQGGIPPTALLSTNLQEELLIAEERGNQGAITQALQSVLNRHRGRLDAVSITLLKAIVVAAKLHMKGDDREDAIKGLSWVSGLSIEQVKKGLDNLQFDLNIVEWDHALCYFDIISDSIPKTQFIKFLKDRRINDYDSFRQEKLFTATIEKTIVIKDTPTNFGEIHSINTREWCFSSKFANINFIDHTINNEISNFTQRIEHDEPKGSIIYCYVGQAYSSEDATARIRKEFQKSLKQQNLSIIPIFIVILHDAEGKLGTLLAEYDILQHLDKSEKEKFANLVPAHEESLKKHIDDLFYKLTKQRHWITPLQTELPQRLSSVGLDIFEQTYKEAVKFSMDGFATSNGNGPTHAYGFARHLLRGTLTYGHIQDMPPTEKNRAITLFKNDWDIFFTTTGLIQKHPPTLQKIFRKWDNLCKEGGVVLSDLFKKLTMPPYGMNSMAALLAICVYLAPRSTTLHIRDKESAISIRDWFDTLLTSVRKKITPQLFGTAKLLLCTDGPDRWSDFLNEWESCTSYKELCNFPARAKEMLNQTPPTSPADILQHFELEQKSIEAKNALMIFNSLEQKAESQLEAAENQQKFELYIASTANYGKLFAMVEEAPECWPSEYKIQFEQRFGEMRQYVMAHFQPWLEMLSPRANSIDGLSDFKAKMEKLEYKLRSIGLECEATELKEAVKKAFRQTEIMATYKSKIVDAENWLQKNTHEFRSMQFVGLQTSRDIAKNFAKELEKIFRNKQLEGLAELRERLSSHQKNLENRVDELRQSLSKALSPSISTIEDIDVLLATLTKLELVFSQTLDARDITDMKSTLQWALSNWKTLRDDISLDAKILNEHLAQFYKKIIEQIEEKELSFSAEKFYEIIASSIYDYRREKSTTWIEDVQNKCNTLSQTSMEKATHLLNFLNTPPSYLTDIDNFKLEQLRKDVFDYLSKQKIDWLVEEFNTLSADQKMIFFERLKSTI